MRHATLVALLILASQPALAQRDTVRADTTRPFVRGGVYDKPYQTRLLGRTAIGGYAEAHARYERVDGVTEEVRSLFEKKGREFVELDLVIVAGAAARPVAHVLHTAIYRLPPPS